MATSTSTTISQDDESKAFLRSGGESTQEEEGGSSSWANNDYGSTTTTKHTDPKNKDEDEEEEDDDFDGHQSFHLGKTKLQKWNILTSVRLTESFIEYGDDYEKVPTLLSDTFALVCDSNLHVGENGKLYYSVDSFYNGSEDPHYVLTVNPDIYERLLKEVSDAHQMPCGLYFCCHGGDQPDDSNFVSIGIAWILVGVVFLCMIVLSILPEANGI